MMTRTSNLLVGEKTFYQLSCASLSKSNIYSQPGVSSSFQLNRRSFKPLGRPFKLYHFYVLCCTHLYSPPSQKICAFSIFVRFIKMWSAFSFIERYPNLLLVYIKLFTIYTTIKILIIMRISLSTNTTLTTLLLFSLTLSILF